MASLVRQGDYAMIHKANDNLRAGGFVLPLVIMVMAILVALTIGAMMTNYASRLQGVRTKAETEAMLAAEAGYERAIFWMSQQTDILGALQNGGGSGTINFTTSRCSYEVSFLDFIGSRAVFKVFATGISGRPSFTKVVDVSVMQEVTGWAMGVCRVPYGTTSTYPVNFADGEIIDIPLHINNLRDSPDERDIYIIGTPSFLQPANMGESRFTSGGSDKYSGVMSLFQDGINFNQPDVRITDEAAIQSKIDRFYNSTALSYRFTPNGTASVTNPRSAVQLEFFVDGGVGKVRLTNNCTVRGYSRADDKTWDYKIEWGSGGNRFQTYDTYAYHYKPNTEISSVIAIEDTYVTQQFGGIQSAPGGQIFIDGDVVIGSDAYQNMVVKDKITVVSTGNIWIADSIVVDGPHTPEGMPDVNNTNVLGLIAKGVIKVVDPGIASGTGNYNTGYRNYYPGSPYDEPIPGHTYQPIGNKKHSYDADNDRYLPDTMVIEAAMTVGGGGFGAENVQRGSYGDRRNYNGSQDWLIVRGSISEGIRGVVGLVGSDGYVKQYYLDTRLLSGILPGDIWLSGKYVPAPAGWHDYHPQN